MSGARSLILVHRKEVQEKLVELALGLPWVPTRGLAFHVAPGDAQQAIADWRKREGHIPLGYIAEDESLVLAALAGGADEAMVLPKIDAAALAAFVDRLELRARLRAETQRL